ncbi:MAG: 50S ribosomal protein L1 [Planctomycetota bacterium]|jgi:large subunit ribosomal protein L1|nr:50S ribosomal protein L1 [Planctomycetota bacterium]
MPFRSKRYKKAADGATSDPQPLAEAVGLVKSRASAKFTESVDLAMRLNIDTRKADQQVRGSFSLPHGTGRDVRVVVFVDDPEKVAGALEAGALKAGGEDLVAEIQGGFMDFDVAIATPKMMRVVGKLGRVLGPRGLMPAPKAGTVTDDVVTAVKEFKAGKIEFRADSAGNVHVRVGTVEFEPQQLEENISAVVRHITDTRPSSVKGDFVRGVSISSTMGPGVRVLV